MYVYYCENCKNMEAFESENLVEKCSVCSHDLVSLHKTDEEWNKLSNSEMVDIIRKMRPQTVKTERKSFFDEDFGLQQAGPKVSSNTCPYCGNVIGSDVLFCPKCGRALANSSPNNEVKIKKKKKAPIIIAIVALVLLLCGGGTFLYIHNLKVKEQQLLQAKKEYYLKANDVVKKIDESSGNFNTLSQMFSLSTEMKTGWLFDERFYTNYTTSLCASEISSERLRKDEIDKLYNVFDATECPAEEMMPLHDAVKSYREAYYGRYSVLVEGGFTPAVFKSKDSTTSSAMSSSKTAVIAELEKYRFLEGE